VHFNLLDCLKNVSLNIKRCLYMSKRQQGKSQETAAACAAISERSGRRVEKGERASIAGERHWRTREDR
jgi:hypothetical protein